VPPPAIGCKVNKLPKNIGICDSWIEGQFYSVNKRGHHFYDPNATPYICIDRYRPGHMAGCRLTIDFMTNEPKLNVISYFIAPDRESSALCFTSCETARVVHINGDSLSV